MERGKTERGTAKQNRRGSSGRWMLAFVAALAVSWIGLPAAADESGGEPVVIPPKSSSPPEESEPEQDFSRPGLYLGLGYVYGLENWEDYEANNTMGLGFQLGYRINHWAAAEINLEWLSDFRNDLPGKVGVVNTTVKGKFYPLEGRFQPYAAIGIGILATITERSTELGFRSEADWATKTGIGIDIYAWGPLVFNAEATYVWTLGDVSDLDYASFGAGLMYRF